MSWHRIRTWTMCRALDLRCAVTGHNYRQHFTEMMGGRPDDGETPWCDKCGRTEAARRR